MKTHLSPVRGQSRHPVRQRGRPLRVRRQSHDGLRRPPVREGPPKVERDGLDELEPDVVGHEGVHQLEELVGPGRK